MPTPETAGSVLVVIPNFNGADYIEKCIESVLAQTYTNIQIVVVDNASSDGSDALVQRRFPQIDFIQSGFNSGWGVACNTGMAVSKSEFIMCLNNDACLDSRCIEEMIHAIELNPAYGSCAGKVLKMQTPDKIEVCGLSIYPDGSSCGRGRFQPAEALMKAEEIFCVSDCCSLYRRRMFEQIGNYDPHFFLYCDEADIGWRQHFAGWKCIYTPKALAWHAHSQGAGSYSNLKAFYVERNRIFICMKYFSPLRMATSFFFALYRHGYQFFLAFTAKQGALAQYRKEHSTLEGLGILIKAHLSAFYHAPKMFAQRKFIRSITRDSCRDFSSIFKNFSITTRQMASYE